MRHIFPYHFDVWECFYISPLVAQMLKGDLEMVRVSKEVAEERKRIALNLIKNLEPMAEMDENEATRKASIIIIINQLKRTAYGGKTTRFHSSRLTSFS